MRVGVVGIGKMGRPIADRLITAGHEVAICNRSENAAVQSLRDEGATVHASPAGLAAGSDVVGTSFGSSAMLLRNLPRFAARDFSPATPVGLIAKDLSIIHAEAMEAGVPLLLGGLIEQCYLDAKARGWAGEDMSALVKFWDRESESSAPTDRTR